MAAQNQHIPEISSVPSLMHILTAEPVNASDYEWRSIFTSEDIRAYGQTRTISGPVRVDGKSPYSGPMHRYQETIDSVKFTDGSILVCAVFDSQSDTLATHDDVETEYFVLTPIAKG